MEDTKQVIFNIGDNVFGIDIMEIKTIENYVEASTVADLPKNVIGILELRDELIPIYSLRKKLGLEEIESDEETKLLVVDLNDLTIAIKVDKMEEIVEATSNRVYDLPRIIKTQDTNYVDKVASIDGQLVLLLDYNLLISSHEQENMRNMLIKIKKTTRLDELEKEAEQAAEKIAQKAAKKAAEKAAEEATEEVI